MRYYVIINGINSLTIPGLAIKDLPPISKTLMRNQKEEIDGRDGDIITELGYSAYDKTMTIGLYGSYDINQIIAFFNQKGTIVFSDEPDKYYNFTILEKIDYDKLVKFRTASVRIHCQPFKYPVSETPVEIEAEYVTAQGEEMTLNNTGVAPLEIGLKGNTSQEGTPTPDTPQEVQVVTGDNTIKVQNANLLNRETCLENKLLSWAMGVTSNETGSLASDFIKIEIGKTYQFTYKVQLLFYDKDKTYLGAMQDASGSLAKSAPVNYNPTSATIPNNNQICYMRLGYRTGNNSGVDLLNVNIMVNKGNTLLTYIPHQEQNYPINLGSIELCETPNTNYRDYIYGSPNNWYKHKKIVKTRILSTWNWFRDKELTNSWRFYSQSNVLPSCYNNNAMSNYFKGDTATNINTVDSQAITTINYTQIGLRINKSIAPTVEDLKTWLSNNEVYDYTILTTPTEEPITNAELIEQLNNLYYAYAYQEQTNINQENDNLAFILDVSALKKGTDMAIVNNEGNIAAKPIIAVKGNGTLGIYLDNTQMFSLNMTSDITIDTENMEAYDPNTSQLRNRQVTGDYSKFALQPGNNTIKVTGDFTSVTISKYKRWL